MEKIMKTHLKFEGIDNFNRPIFKDENNKRYGSTEKLFSFSASEKEILKLIEATDLVYFGRRFNCEPTGGKPLNEQFIIKK